MNRVYKIIKEQIQDYFMSYRFNPEKSFRTYILVQSNFQLTELKNKKVFIFKGYLASSQSRNSEFNFNDMKIFQVYPDAVAKSVNSTDTKGHIILADVDKSTLNSHIVVLNQILGKS